MRPEILPVDAASPSPAVLQRAAEVLRAGGLVAFPTETVYGLGAAALDSPAVARIFAAKGRPANNPLIVHVPGTEEARALAAEWPAAAEKLSGRFWPGPLTLVVSRRLDVPDIVTAGGPTVALRVPAHPVALGLLRTCGFPLAAPSANRSTQLSPTQAEHVHRSLGADVDLILDAGPTPGGLESTVVDVTCVPPRLLRPGLVALAELDECLGAIGRAAASPDKTGPLRAPGQFARHYAPQTPLEVAFPSRPRVVELTKTGLRVGWLTRTETAAPPAVVHLVLPGDVTGYAAGLYDALHRLDQAGLDRIVVELPPDDDAWLAVRDRLRRAAEK